MFATSGTDLDMESAATTSPTLSTAPDQNMTTPWPSSSLSERLEQLATVAWAAEQDDQLKDVVTKELHSRLDGFELSLATGDTIISGATASLDLPTTNTIDGVSASEQGPTSAALEELLSHLSTTVSSLRLRLHEHRHLHEVVTDKLEAAAQHSLIQERAIRDLSREIENLSQENNALGSENDGLRNQVDVLKSKTVENRVAMEAMTGAVAGLAGWIERSSPSHARHGLVSSNNARDDIRGRGSFRGRYPVDGFGRGQPVHGLDGVLDTDVLDLHEGVKAWLRGFRDVEEGLRARGREHRSDFSLKASELEEVRTAGTEDEWGDFESG